MLYLLEEEGVINDAIRNIFAAINDGIYTLIAITYNLIEDLARISILSLGDMNEFAQRIYMLLGLFMLFKVSFSIISYIVDPGKMNDKVNGFSGIIKNTIVTLILILIVPTCFSLLYEAQDAILTDQIIPKLIMGESQETSEMTDDSLKFYISPNYCDKTLKAKDNGHFISLMIFRPFLQPDENHSPTKEDFEERGNDAAYRYCAPALSPIMDMSEIDWEEVFIDSAIGPFQALINDDSSTEIDAQTVEQLEQDYKNGKMEVTVSSFLSQDSIVNSANGADGIGSWSDYDLKFNYFISLLVGIAVELIIIGIAFDVAVRSIKLTFLQLISPIPIVSYIDPKSGKDGMFKRWYQEVFKTWASLFIKLLAVFFGVYLIQQLNGTLYTFDSKYQVKSQDLWIILFLIIGILMFMKQLPSLLESLIPGMKGAGSFNLNPFKKVKDEALGGKALLGTAGALGAGALGLAGAGIAHGFARRQLKKDFSKKEADINGLRNKMNFNNAKKLSNQNQIRSLETSKSEIEKLKNQGIIDANFADRVNARKDQKINDLKSNNVNLDAKNASLKEDMTSKTKDLEEKKSKSRLYKNPIRGYMGSISRGALKGMKEGYKNPGKFFSGGVSAVESASKFRDYRDKYGMKDQVLDKLTDIANIKNESGTSDLVKKDIKKFTNALADVERNIEMLNRSLSNYHEKLGADFDKVISYNEQNRMVFNEKYASADYADALRSTLDNYYGQIDEKIRLERAIKEAKDMTDIGVSDKK